MILMVISLSSLTVTAESETGDSLSSAKVPIDSTATGYPDSTAIELEGIMVTAQRPLVQVKADRTVYDVKNDEDAKTSTLIEILRKVPFVTVDGDNSIKVKGGSNFKVYKNGRPNQSFSKNPKEVLSSIPASMIKRVEVITEPGAKYDAEGLDGILNIVVDDEVVVKGISGSIFTGTNTQNQPFASLWSMAQYGKLVGSAYLNAQRSSEEASLRTNHSDYVYRDTGNRLLTDMETSNQGEMYSFGFEASYEADSLNLLTVSLDGFSYDVDMCHNSTNAMFDSGGRTLYSYSRAYLAGSDYRYFDIEGKVDYQHLTRRKGESINLSYLLSTTWLGQDRSEQFSNIVNYPDYTSLKDRMRNNYMEHTFQADWTRPVSERQTLDFGAKYILRVNDSRTDQERGGDGNGMPLSDFCHTTHVGALYGEWSMTLNRLNLIGGLRYEWAYMAAKFRDGSNDNFHKTIGDLVPSLTAKWRIDDANSLKLSYNMRINRPGISYLNPAVFRYPTSVSSGNPDLSSANQHNLALSYSLMKQNIYMTVGADAGLSNNLITPLKYVSDGLMYSTYGNVGRMRIFGFSAYIQWKITKTTTFVQNGYLRYIRYYNDDMGLDNHRWNVRFHSQLTQKLPWRLRVELQGGRYGGDPADMYSYNSGTFYHAFVVSRSFLKNDRMNVRFVAYCPFESHNNSKYNIVNGDYTGISNSRSNARNISIALSYRFGSLDTSVKKTKKSIENSDLIGRK